MNTLFEPPRVCRRLWRCLEDDAAPLKQRFLTNQLNVRIEIRAYERLTESGAS